jgi:FlaA1/EpsC-like NDP-sugar epimerase
MASVGLVMRRRWRNATLGVLFVAPLLALSYYTAFLLRFGGQLTAEATQVFALSVSWVLYAKCLGVGWSLLESGLSRVVSFHDLKVVLKGSIAGALGMIVIDTLAIPEYAVPRSVVLLDWGITFLGLCTLRALPRVWDETRSQLRRSTNQTRVLIVGASEKGATLLREIHRNTCLAYQVVGFLDDRTQLTGQLVAGIAVLGTTDDLATVAARYEVAEVLITTGEVDGRTVRKLHQTAAECGLRVKVLPSYEQLIEQHVSIKPREVAIEDLLQRDSISIDLDAIGSWLEGRVVLVTGSAGSIGSEICRQLLALRPTRLVVLDRSETGQFFLDRELRRLAPDCQIETVIADATDRDRIEAVFAKYGPDIVFHAAAYKHVPLMELHPGEAIKNIVLATRNLVDVAEQCGTSAFVMISTDKAVNPTSVMGSCKQLAERYVQSMADRSSCRFVTVRFGNVLDSAGSVVPVFREQISRGGPVTVTHPDIIRYFMLIPEAAQLVLQAGAMGQGGEIFVLDMGEPVKIVDLARDMIRLSGLREGHDIEIAFTGLRPGEKLYEELYNEGEHHRRTAHRKIMVADSERTHLLHVVRDISALELLANDETETIVAKLREVVRTQDEAKLASNRRRAA